MGPSSAWGVCVCEPYLAFVFFSALCTYNWDPLCPADTIVHIRMKWGVTVSLGEACLYTLLVALLPQSHNCMAELGLGYWPLPWANMENVSYKKGVDIKCTVTICWVLLGARHLKFMNVSNACKESLVQEWLLLTKDMRTESRWSNGFSCFKSQNVCATLKCRAACLLPLSLLSSLHQPEFQVFPWCLDFLT